MILNYQLVNEQLFIRVRFFDSGKMMVREAIPGFTELKAIDAILIANAIRCFVLELELDVEKYVG